ncbi:TlpA family protein disulfide reductase [Flagellimonas meridianipacifica]|uniref:Thiol-disulfide isomerase/thioredoxin n=1 Tax=Flagellimonas meridianipacifica TaxID=1080225 RepID=A0A2T0M6W3_9FLAO|nr:TlpA disulfide reductase family protein [Allomuricauda pacifica]PRX53211.1 thiol-disulfide isomerase/thioredoxin [Allomuricauda pacifica]
MRLSKEQIGNLIWIVVILLILFTPVGFHARVLVGRIFAFDADVIEVEERKQLNNYQWSLLDIEGNPSNLESYNNKVVVVNFWATWCPPCIAEMPSFAKLYEDYGDKVDFFFIANDEKEKVIAFLEKKGYKLPVYFEISQTPEMLTSKSIPATFILNKSGKIVVEERGVADWNSQSTRKLLDDLLAE